MKALVRKILPEKLEIHLQALDHYFQGEPELRLLSRLCDRERMALDIGANIGTYSYFMRRYSSRVVAYEPNPLLAARLRRIFCDVEVREKAVSDAAGALELVIPLVEGRAMHELGSVAQDFAYTEAVHRYCVEVVKVDEESFANVGFIKIDVEQNEIPVLRGACETIARCRPLVMTEVTPLLYERGLVETFDFILAMDYEGWFTFDNQKISFANFVAGEHADSARFGRNFMSANVFFIPRECRARETIWDGL